MVTWSVLTIQIYLLKLIKSKRFWEWFFLSLPGKIIVYKSLLLAQINYIATVLTPTQDIINDLEKKMEKFVIKGSTLANDKIYGPVQEGGGVGAVQEFIHEFICALQSSWIKRCAQSMNDNWKLA
jgi:hypothetical protein